jgi:hypothetical protein
MDFPNKVPAKLLRACTLDEMLETVPLLGDYDSLEAIPPLATYDRMATGWFAAVFTWLGIMLTIAWLMSSLAVLVAAAGWALNLKLRPSADELIDGLGGTPLQILIALVGLMLVVLAFNFAGPRRWLVNSTRTLCLRLRLRILLLRAIRSQLDRNRRMVDNDWRNAVCRNCLARYELHRVRFAYWRWLSFARCRTCHGDHVCYTRARKIEGWLDDRMAASQEQTGDAVRVNLLHCLPPQSLPLPADLDELVVADTEDEDVETLIFFYRSVQPQTSLPKPKRLRFRLTEDSNVSQMSWRQLNRNFRFVSAALPRHK